MLNIDEKSIEDFMEKTVTFRGTKEEIEVHLKKMFPLGVSISKSEQDVTLDESFIFTFENDLLLVYIDMYYIKDLQGNYYITEVACTFE